MWGEDHNIISFVEIDKFCQKVLAKHWPDVPIQSDIKEYKHDGTNIHLITGGFPCQPFSCAGKRRGAEDDRALWPEMLRIISECRPRWVIGENVAGIINMELDTVLAKLENEGYTTETFIIPACAVDAPHRRDRVWIVGHATGDGFQNGRGTQMGQSGTESESKRPDSKRCGIQGQDVADTESINLRRDSEQINGGGQVSGQNKIRGYGGCSGKLETRKWLPESNVGRVVARLSPNMDGGGLDGNKILQALWDSYGKATMEKRDFRLNLEKEKILQQQMLRTLDGKQTNSQENEWEKNSTTENQGRCLSEMQFKEECSETPQRQQPEQQRSEKSDGPLPEMPYQGTHEIWNLGDRWVEEPNIGRVATGVKNRVDRLKSLGNAIVPQVVVPIMQAIKAINDN